MPRESLGLTKTGAKRQAEGLSASLVGKLRSGKSSHVVRVPTAQGDRLVLTWTDKGGKYHSIYLRRGITVADVKKLAGVVDLTPPEVTPTGAEATRWTVNGQMRPRLVFASQATAEALTRIDDRDVGKWTRGDLLRDFEVHGHRIKGEKFDGEEDFFTTEHNARAFAKALRDTRRVRTATAVQVVEDDEDQPEPN